MHAEIDRSGANPRITGQYRCPQPFPTEEVPDGLENHFELINGTWQEGPYLQAQQSDTSDRQQKGTRVKQSIAALRQWALDGASVVAGWDAMTAAQRTAATKVAIERQGIFYDRFADFLEWQRMDKQ